MGFFRPKKASVDTVDTVDLTEEEKRKAKKNRVSLFKTEGGVSGEEVENTRQRRSTLLGN